MSCCVTKQNGNKKISMPKKRIGVEARATIWSSVPAQSGMLFDYLDVIRKAARWANKIFILLNSCLFYDYSGNLGSAVVVVVVYITSIRETYITRRTVQTSLYFMHIYLQSVLYMHIDTDCPVWHVIWAPRLYT